MARIPRTHGSRSIRVWPGMDNDDTPGGGAVAFGAADVYSNPVRVGVHTGYCSFQLIWADTAAVTGTFTLQIALVADPELATDADWVTVTPTLAGTSLTVADNAGNSVVSIPPNHFAEWARIKYAHTSGTGTIRAFARTDLDR